MHEKDRFSETQQRDGTEIFLLLEIVGPWKIGIQSVLILRPQWRNRISVAK